MTDFQKTIIASWEREAKAIADLEALDEASGGSHADKLASARAEFDFARLAAFLHELDRVIEARYEALSDLIHQLAIRMAEIDPIELDAPTGEDYNLLWDAIFDECNALMPNALDSELEMQKAVLRQERAERSCKKGAAMPLPCESTPVELDAN